ncbi:MAG TPA: HNH endonuclease domain-containing protein [Gaiellales bacterium]
MNDPIEFGERAIALLDRAAVSTSLKYALLLGLIELAHERTDSRGEPPDIVTTREIAMKVAELYWPQTRAFTASHTGQSAVLKQSGTGQLAVVRQLGELRNLPSIKPTTTLTRAAALHPIHAERVLRRVEWSLIVDPLPRLQHVGTDAPFIYSVDWTSTEPGSSKNLPRAVVFLPGAGRHLQRLTALLRPLLERRWADYVAARNSALLDYGRLDSHLFGQIRRPTGKLMTGLRDLQRGSCFYCRTPLSGATAIDHFIPWSLHFDDGAFNLIATHARCNGSKADHLPAAVHVERWVRRFAGSERVGIEQLTKATTWETNPARTLSIARSVYAPLQPDSRLWIHGDSFEAADAKTILQLLAAAPAITEDDTNE